MNIECVQSSRLGLFLVLRRSREFLRIVGMLMCAMGVYIFALVLKAKNVIQLVADEIRQVIKRLASALRRKYEYPKGIQHGILCKNRGPSPINPINLIHRLASLIIVVSLALSIIVATPASAASANGITIITHGYLTDQNLPAWVNEMAYAIKGRTGFSTPTYRVWYNPTNANNKIQLCTTISGTCFYDDKDNLDITGTGGAILLLDWAAVSDHPDLTAIGYSTQDIADSFAIYLFTQTFKGHSLAELPIHLIGHSRGASLNSRLAYQLATNGILVDQVTSLDPHPVRPFNVPPGNDVVPEAYGNVIYADNYFRTGMFPAGQLVTGADNYDRSTWIVGTSIACREHQEVHTYYYGSISLTAMYDGFPAEDFCRIQDSWYQQSTARNQIGYNFSRYGSVPRPLSGLNRHIIDNDLGGIRTGVRIGVPLTFNSWPNAFFDQRKPLPVSATVGGSAVPIPFHYTDQFSTQTITFFTDNDTNPLNGVSRDIGVVQKIARPQIGTTTTIGTSEFQWTPTVADVGPDKYIGVKTTNFWSDFSRVRYDYYLKPITILAAPVVTIPAPSISYVSLPSSVASSSPQTITIYGTNFTNSSTLTFVHPAGSVSAGRLPQFEATGELKYTSSFPTEGQWQVKVVNGTTESQPYAFTMAPPAVQLSSISIYGPATINENGSEAFTAFALLSDSSTPAIQPVWSVSGTAASINSTTGQLSAGAVSSNTPVTITASYTLGGIARTSTFGITILDTASGGSGLAQELITNGGFENGSTGWVLSGAAVVSGQYFHAGTKYAVMAEANGNADTMYQAVAIPANATAATLSYWYNILSDDPGSAQNDNFNVSVRNTSGTVLATVDIKWNTEKDPGPGNPYYHQKTFDLLPYRGQTIWVHFRASTDSTYKSYFKIDDVSVQVAVPQADTTPPTAPSGLSATGASSSQINLSWAAASDSGGSGLAGYEIWRCLGSACSNFALLATTPVTSFSDTGLGAGTSYSYRVRSFDGSGNPSASYSNTAFAATQTVATSTVPSVTTLAATNVTGTSATLNGTITYDGGSAVLERMFEWGAGPGVSGVIVSGFSVNGNNFSYTLTGLLPETAYTFRAIARNSYGWAVVPGSGSFTTGAAPDSTAPTAPASLVATGVSTSQIDLTWTASTDTGGSGLSGYRIERCTGQNCSTFSQIGTSTTAAYSDATGLAVGTDYTYRVRAYDGANNTSAYSPSVLGTTYRPPDTTAPTVLSVSPANGATSVVVNGAVAVTFSEFIDYLSVNGTSFVLRNSTGTQVPANVVSSGGMATLTPSANLAFNTTYTVTLTTAVKDYSGNPLAANYAWTFTTRSASTSLLPVIDGPQAISAEQAVNPKVRKFGSNLYVIDGSANRNLVFRKSTNGGSTFTGTVLANPVMNFRDYDFCSDSSGNLFAVWTQSIPSGDVVYLRRSLDSGDSWSAQVALGTGFGWMDSPSCHFSSGILYVAFRAFNNATAKIELYLTKSSDSGSTFSTPVQLTNNAIQEDSPVVAVSGSNVYVAYFDQFSATPNNILLIRSTDGGATFGAAVRVNRTANKSVNGYSMTVDSAGRIYIAYSDSSGADYDVYVAKSTNGGVSFSSVLASSPTLGYQGPASIFVDSNNYVHVSWSDSMSSSVVYTRSTDAGASFATNVALRASGGLSNGSIFVDGGIGYLATNSTTTNPYTSLLYQVTWVSGSVPGAPTAVNATAGNGQATVNFAAPADNGGNAIASYELLASPGGESFTGAAPPIVATGLSNGTAYTFTVSARNAAGKGAPSAPSNSVVPVVPVPPQCSLSASPGTIAFGAPTTLSATCVPAATSYAWVNSGLGSSVASGSVSPAVSTSYSVTGSNLAGPGNTASVTVTVTPGTGSIQVNLGPAGAASAGAQWQVDGGAFQNSGAVVSGLSLGNHLIAFKPVSGWTKPGDRTVVVQANQTFIEAASYVVIPIQYALNVAMAGTGAGAVSYTGGYICPGTCSHAYDAGSSVTLTASPYIGSTFAGWSGGGCSGTGICTVSTNAALTATASFIDSAAPTVPAGLTAAVISAVQVNLAWSASTDNIGVSQYRIYRDGVLVAVQGAVTGYVDSNASPGTPYSYAVQACDAAGNCSARSGVSSVSTLQGTQTILFGTVPTLAVGGNGAVSATGGSSGNAISFTSLTTGVCTISGGTANGLTAGTCTLAANQAGNANYAAALQVTQNITVAKATAVITWATPVAIAYGTALSATQLNASSGGVAGTFAYTPASGTVLNVGNGQTLSVTFSPTDTANYNTPAQTTVSINVTANSQTASLSTTSLTFPPQAQGSTSVAQLVTLTNTGSSSLTISSITISGDFVKTTTCGNSLVAGTNCTITVAFTPTSAGTLNAALSIVTDAVGSPSTVALTGSATTQPGFLYVLNDSTTGNAIYGFSVDEATGALAALPGFPVATGGMGNADTRSEELFFDRANARLFAINSGSSTISVFSANTTTGALTALPYSPFALPAPSVPGSWACLAVHPSGSPLVVGDRDNFRIASFNVSSSSAALVNTASTSNDNNMANAFSCAFSRDGNYFYTGGNWNFLSKFGGFRVDPGTGSIAPLAGSPFGASFAPAAYVTDAQGRMFLTTNGIPSSVLSYTSSSGIPTSIGSTLSGLTTGVSGALHPAGFYMSADRTGNRIGVYSIAGSGASTAVAPVAGSPFASGGTLTEALALNQAGNVLFAANGNSRNISVFAVNNSTGILVNTLVQPADTLGSTGRLVGMAYAPPSVGAIPDPFVFTPQPGLALGATAVSNAVTIAGLGAAVPISVTGGEYSINGGAFTSAGGSVSNGQTVTARITAASTFSTTTSAIVTVGVATSSFSVTTLPAAVTRSPSSLNFANHALGATSAAQTVTLANNAATPLAMSGITISGDFAYTSACGNSLPAGNTCTIGVTFAPTAMGARTGTLSIATTDASSPHTVSLLGTGTVPMTLTVTNLNDSGAGSLRDAIAQANSNPGPDTIGFAAGLQGRITLTTGQLGITDALTINGPGAALLTIDGNLNGRIFAIDNATQYSVRPDFLVTLSGLTLTNGKKANESGGAIRSYKSLALANVVLTANEAVSGGAISFLPENDAALTIDGSTLSSNTAVSTAAAGQGYGGGLLASWRYLVTKSTVTVTNSRIENNVSDGGGGGMLVQTSGLTKVSRSAVVGNQTKALTAFANGRHGGGVSVGRGDFLMEDSEVSGNLASDKAGGLNLWQQDPNLQAPASKMQATVANSTISGNSAGSTAGGIALYGNLILSLNASTVVNNTSPAGSTAGIRIGTGATIPASVPPSDVVDSQLNVLSSIVWNNLAGTTALDVARAATFTTPSTPITANYSLAGVVSSTIAVTGTGNMLGIDPKLGPLANNGGSTQTHLPQADSPALGSGACINGVPADQRGASRPPSACDIGAVELASAGQVPGSPTAIVATPGNGSATINFTAPASDGGSPITSYTVTVSPGGLTKTAAAGPVTFTGLSNGTTYSFRVAATNSAGTGAASAASNSIIPAAVPGAPTIGTATAGNASASVSFTAPTSDGGAPITGYTVVATPGGQTGSGTISPVVVTGLTNGTAYTFTVKATNVIGTGAESAASNSVTPIPTSSGPVIFTDNFDGTALQSAYWTKVGVGTPLTVSNGLANFACQVGASTVGKYVFSGSKIVVETRMAGTGSGRDTAFALIDANNPGHIQVGDTNYQGMGLYTYGGGPFVMPQAGSGGSVSAYKEYRLTIDGTALTLERGDTLAAITQTRTVTLPASIAGKTFYLQIWTAASPYCPGTFDWIRVTSETGTVLTPPTAPDAPTIGTATAGNTTATVAFTPPANDGAATIASYTVTSSPGSLTATGTASPITVPGLTNGIAYTFTVKATNSVGTSALSAASNSVIPSAAPTCNIAPATASIAFGTGQVFTANCTNSPTNYQWLLDGSLVASGAGNSYGSGTGLAVGTHTLTVTASNAGGASAPTNASLTINAAAINGACGAGNGRPVATAPTTGLCTAGTSSSVTGTGPWNWSCAGSNGGTTASCSASVATAGAPFINDQFDGTTLNSALWTSGGNSVTVHDGYLDLQANQTDNTGWVKTTFSERQHVRVELLHKMHAGGAYFFPSINLGTTNPNGPVAVRWLRSSYGPDYCSLAANFDKVELFAGATPNATCSWAFSNLLSSSFYDRWVLSILDYDSISGLVTLDADGDGTVDFSATVATANRAPVTSLDIQSYGWFTGHSHQVDYIKVFDSAASLAGQTLTFGAAPVLLVGGIGTVSATASSSLPVSYSVSTPAVCSLSGTTVTGLTAGTCTVTANQAGNGSYAPAPQAVQNFVVETPIVAPSGPAVSLSATGLSFASQSQGSTSSVQTITLTNTGIGSLNIGSIVATGDFARVTNCGSTLAAGTSCTISVTFTPAATGTRNGTVSIASNATGSPHSISLSGTGSAATTVRVILAQGWNLLGNSLNQTLSMATLFSDPAVVSTVWKWENTGSRWLFFTPMLDATALQTYAVSKGYGVLTQVGPGEGYWVNAKIATELAAQMGSAFVLTTAQLAPGWNLVATGQDVTPSIFNRSLSDTPPSPGVVPQNLTSLWAWDNPANGWYFYAPRLEAQGGTALIDYITSKGYRDFTEHSKTLGNGAGFWVRRP